jgi:SAM-dependent methyltransferase
MDCTKPEFWEQRYRAGRMPWDCHGAPPALGEFLRSAGRAGSVLVPGCGSGYEVAAFHRHGWRPSAIDFSPAAVDRARGVLGKLGTAVQIADFFADDVGGPFDLVYERTFLCSLPPERRPGYIRRVAMLLKPKGRLAGFFVYGNESEPPPFPLDETEAISLFSGFELIEDRPIPPEQSLPLFADRERWQVWQLT